LEAQRYASLVRAGVVSKEQNDQIQATAGADDSLVRADQAAVDTAKLNLSYCTISAPIDGRTGSLLVQAGNLVQPNNTMLVTINQIAPIYVSFSVPEQYLQQLKTLNAQHPLTITAQGQGDDHQEEGRLSFINNSIDNTTGTIQLMATFPNASERLWPGQFVNVEITLSILDRATVVPTTAVLTGQDNMYVYVLMANGTVQSRNVVKSITTGAITVLSSGVNPGDTVVTDGQLALFPGAKVQVRSAAGSTPAAQRGSGATAGAQ
jgi:multidrug efflux system membrane fusion protein